MRNVRTAVFCIAMSALIWLGAMPLAQAAPEADVLLKQAAEQYEKAPRHEVSLLCELAIEGMTWLPPEYLRVQAKVTVAGGELETLEADIVGKGDQVTLTAKGKEVTADWGFMTDAVRNPLLEEALLALASAPSVLTDAKGVQVAEWTEAVAGQETYRLAGVLEARALLHDPLVRYLAVDLNATTATVEALMADQTFQIPVHLFIGQESGELLRVGLDLTPLHYALIGDQTAAQMGKLRDEATYLLLTVDYGAAQK